jgi:hypothetical protein
MNKLLFGSDPEYFITETIEGKEYAVPVPFFIENGLANEVGYDETRKHPVLFKENGYNIIMDGVAAEFNVKPAHTPKELFNTIQSGLQRLGDFASQFGYNVSVKPTVFYDFAKWYKEGNKALEWCGMFGCDPDRDAIVETYDSPTIDVVKHIYRYGGGHLHMSDDNFVLDKLPLPTIRILAIMVGNYCIANSPYPELESLRAFRYGQPGKFRIQNYPNGVSGIEYRSPSNVWTANLDMMEGVFYWANRAYELVQNRDKAVVILNEYLDQTIMAFKNNDQSLSKSILSAIQ